MKNIILTLLSKQVLHSNTPDLCLHLNKRTFALQIIYNYGVVGNEDIQFVKADRVSIQYFALYWMCSSCGNAYTRTLEMFFSVSKQNPAMVVIKMILYLEATINNTKK